MGRDGIGVVWQDELPAPFTCVICRRVIEPNKWNWRDRHKPPVCVSCAAYHGHQVRIPGMTRGDHHQLQRLSAIANVMGANIGYRRRGYY